jgi:hypothetical protein
VHPSSPRDKFSRFDWIRRRSQKKIYSYIQLWKSRFSPTLLFSIVFFLLCKNRTSRSRFLQLRILFFHSASVCNRTRSHIIRRRSQKKIYSHIQLWKSRFSPTLLLFHTGILWSLTFYINRYIMCLEQNTSERRFYNEKTYFCISSCFDHGIFHVRARKL